MEDNPPDNRPPFPGALPQETPPETPGITGFENVPIPTATPQETPEQAINTTIPVQFGETENNQGGVITNSLPTSANEENDPTVPTEINTPLENDPQSTDTQPANTYAETTIEKNEDSPETIMDPEILAAGDKAVKKLMNGIPKDLSEDEKKVVDGLAEKVRATAISEAEEDKEKSPEQLMFKMLDALHAKLLEAGLEQDASIVADQIERFKNIIDAATDIIDDPVELRYFEGSPRDDSRLEYLLRNNPEKTDDISYARVGSISLSDDMGKGRRRDRSGSWYKPEMISEYAEYIEQGGGLNPIMSDEGLRIILAESEILGADESLRSLETERERPGVDQFIYSSNGSFRIASNTPGAQHVEYSQEAWEDGGFVRSLSIRPEPGFVIQAALRRIEARQ